MLACSCSLLRTGGFETRPLMVSLSNHHPAAHPPPLGKGDTPVHKLAGR